jgi:hypothetical protein
VFGSDDAGVRFLPGALCRPVAVRAIDGSVISGHKRHLGLATAARAGRTVHFAWAEVRSAALRGTTLCSASWAAFWILVSALGVVCLVLGTENELCAALGTS